jgi:hypothetical protein
LYASQMSVVLRPHIISVVALAAFLAGRERKEIESRCQSGGYVPTFSLGLRFSKIFR